MLQVAASKKLGIGTEEASKKVPEEKPDSDLDWVTLDREGKLGKF